MKAHFLRRCWDWIQQSGYVHENISALDAFQTMVNVARLVGPPSRIATTLQSIHIAYEADLEICDQTAEIQIGGYYSPLLEGPTPSTLAQTAVQDANNSRHPPVFLLPNPIRLPPNDPGFQVPTGTSLTPHSQQSGNDSHH